MKFTLKFPRSSLDLLNLRARIQAEGCRHCQQRSTVVSHGFLLGYAADGSATPSITTRGLRFFCSNRYSNSGCGRTFSVHWDSIIPSCSLRCAQLLELIRTVANGATTHGAWQASCLPISLTSAYRWVKKWTLGTATIRSLLCLLRPPPAQQCGTKTEFLTLQHLTQAFPADPSDRCPIAAFQCHFQAPIL